MMLEWHYENQPWPIVARATWRGRSGALYEATVEAVAGEGATIPRWGRLVVRRAGVVVRELVAVDLRASAAQWTIWTGKALAEEPASWSNQQKEIDRAGAGMVGQPAHTEGKD